VGNGILFLQARQKLFAWFTECVRRHGHETLHITVPSLPPGVIIADPANLDFVFRHEGIFEKGAFFTDRSRDLFGNGIINVDGDLWKRQRKAGLQFLSASNLKVLTDVVLPRLLRESVGYLEARADGVTVVDVQDVVHDITTQLMGKMAYGMEMHTGDAFTEAFEYSSGATAERFQNPLWFITELVTGKRLRRSIRIIKDYGRAIVARAMAERHSTGKSHQSNGDGARGSENMSGSLIHSLLDLIGDETLVADSALNYLSAGRDTVAQALTWTFYLLMKHSSPADKVRVEARGRDGDGVMYQGDTVLEPEQMTPTKLPYIMAVFYESLRLHPPIPFEIKQAQQDTTLPDGTFLPKTSIVFWSPWAMNRSTLTWGDDAEEFRPERWLAEGQLVNRSAAEFPVFNGGSRLCLGKKMAELIAVQVIATWSNLFEFVPAYEGVRVSRSSLTLPMDGGLPVFVKRRK
jgi:cytochrome P450